MYLFYYFISYTFVSVNIFLDIFVSFFIMFFIKNILLYLARYLFLLYTYYEVIKLEIGETIKELRKSANLTQKELAKLSGIAEITIRKYENNDRNPKKEQIEKIAKALNVTPFEIAGFDYWDDSHDLIKLSNESMLLDYIEKHYGSDLVELLRNYNLLNDIGKQKATDYISDLSEQEKYKS